MTDLLRSLQELYRLHPLPWRSSGFGFVDYAGCVVSSERCAAILSHGYDIVPLLEQCEMHGSPEETAANAADEIAEAEKFFDAQESEMQRDIDDLEADVCRLENEVAALERENEGLQETIDDLREIIKAAGLDDD